MSTPKVIVYSQPGWPFCDLDKAWLSERGIDFEYRNVTEDPDAMDELLALGFFSTPVTVVNDEDVVGFDRAKLKDLLGME